MEIVTVLFLVLALAPPITTRPQRSLVLTYPEKEGKVLYYSDGNDVVFAYFDTSDDLVDCDIGKMNNSQPIFQEALSGRPQESRFITFDVRRLARRCRRYLRKMLRLEKEKSTKAGSMHQRIKLHMGYPETTWCMTNRPTPGKRAGQSNKVDQAADKCCEDLHNCTEVIEATAVLRDVYNYYPWPVYSCGCTKTFYQCLREADTPTARGVGHIYFNVVGVRCYREEERPDCEKWDPWYTKCLSYYNRQTIYLEQPTPFEEGEDSE